MANCCGQENYPQPGGQKDRRQHLITQIREFIGDLDKQCSAGGAGSNTVGRAGGGGGTVRRAGARAPTARVDMEAECRKYRKRRDCTPPIITTIGTHEIRATSDYSNMRHENSGRVTYVDAARPDPSNPMPPAPWETPRVPSQELIASNLYTSCDCLKRNGLQQDCRRTGCGGRPQCLATAPGPCCEPSRGRKPGRGDRRDQGGQPEVGLQTASSSVMSVGGSTSIDVNFQRGTPDSQAKKRPKTPKKKRAKKVASPEHKTASGTSVVWVWQEIPEPTTRPDDRVDSRGVYSQGIRHQDPKATSGPYYCVCQEARAQAGPMTAPGARPAPRQDVHPTGPEASSNPGSPGRFLAVTPSGMKYICCPMV